MAGIFSPAPKKKDETGMKLTKDEGFRGAGRRMGQSLMVWGLVACGLAVMGLVGMAFGQAVSTTTVQGTVYLANGQAGAGTLDVSWPAFTTAQGQAVTAGRASVTIAPDGFVSVNLAPNLGAMPAGLYYTAIYHLSDGTTSTEYWVVPAAAQAALGQVRAQVMPAAQAVQAVSKAYVDQSISELTLSLLTASGGTLSGPLYLNGDPTQALQAADKHYVDSTFNMEVPLAGGNMTGPLTTPAVNGVQAPAVGSPQTTLQAAINAAGTSGAMEIPPTYAGTDSFTNPNGVRVADLRSSGAQQTERSVKEFGAVCDGATDDTNALQLALNYALAHSVALTIPQGICKTQSLSWHGESMGGLGKQVSALMGFPGQDVLAAATDSVNLLASTHLHDLTIYVDQSADVSCSPALGRMAVGTCALGRQMEKNSIFSPGGNGLAGTAGTGSGWAVGNCAIAMSATTGAGGNGLRNAVIENLEITTTGTDPMAAQYPGAHSTHTCGLFLGQWPQWSEFRNIDIRGLNTGIAIPALPGTTPAGLNADSNRWQNITMQTTHGFTAAAGSNNVLDNVVVMAANSAATAEPPTGLVLDFAGAQEGWTVRNAVVLPAWNAVQPQLAVAASGGAVTGVTAGPEHGLGFDPYGTQVPLKFSGSCTAAATASVNSDGSIGTISVTQGGVGCSATTTASVNVAGTWDTAAPVNLIGGQNMSFFAGNLLKGNGGYTVWNAAGSQSYGTQLDGGGGTLPGGGSYAALVASGGLGSAYPVDQFPGVDFGARLQACLNTVSALYGGTCDARNFTGNVSMGSNLTISTGNTTVDLPCATIATANQVIVTAGTRNVALRGCALRGGSTASGNQGGTVFQYSGAGAMVQVGDPSYAADTLGFHMDNAIISTTAASSATAQGLVAYRTQEMDLESLYFLGNPNQTGMTLDGTGNYTGGTFLDNEFDGFQTAVNAIGHQISNAATTDWMNASTFVRLHIDCPTSGGSPIAGTYGINLQQGDGNTFIGGDVEGCSTALHLGPNAQNNTLVGVRNENSNNQVVADAGSSYNNWMTGGTMFTGQLTDNGTRNSFLDTFHRSFNGLNGDWYGSQKDATVTNHYRIGTGAGNERGLLDRFQTDYGYRWTTGLSDATAGEQFYQVLDELNNVYRLSIGQYNNGQGSTNNQTAINAAGTGAVVLNGSNNAGTGGVVIGSGGASASTVATISNSGNAQFNGTLQVGGTAQATGTMTVRNNSDAEVDYYLWPGLTASQKGSFTYKDWNGNSQWYMVKDASNNWALNSATGGLDSFKAYQSNNSGDTYINASNASGVVRVNYETGSGTGFNIYGGGSGTIYASFTGSAAIKFPGLAAGSGHNCLQIDNSGYITNTGSACGSGSGSGTVSSGNVGQIAYYAANGTAVSGTSAVPVTAGGTGATTAAGALAALGAQAAIPGLSGDGKTTPGIQVSGTVVAGAAVANTANGIYNTAQYASGSSTGGIQEAYNACVAAGVWATCSIQLSADITISSAQTFAPTIPTTLISAGHMIHCSNGSGAYCLTANGNGVARKGFAWRDFVIDGTGSTGNGLHLLNMIEGIVSGVVQNFKASGSQAVLADNVEDSHLTLSLEQNANQLSLINATNNNEWTTWIGDGVGGISLNIASGSSGNTFRGLIQSNIGPQTVLLDATLGTLVRNDFDNLHFENNGDGTSASRLFTFNTPTGVYVMNTEIKNTNIEPGSLGQSGDVFSDLGNVNDLGTISMYNNYEGGYAAFADSSLTGQNKFIGYDETDTTSGASLFYGMQISPAGVSYPNGSTSSVTSLVAGSGISLSGSTGVVTISNSAGAPTLSYAGGDLLCAHAADNTIASAAITGGTSSTLSVSSLPNAYTQVGTLVGVTGATPSGLNGGPYSVASTSGGTITFSSLPATWTSGGNIYLWCANQSTDAIANNPNQYFANNKYTTSPTAGNSATMRFQLAYWSTATAPYVIPNLRFGSALLWSDFSAVGMNGGETGTSSEVTFDAVSPMANSWIATLQSGSLGSNTVGPNSGYKNPLSVSSGAQAFEFGVAYNQTGLGSITSGSGGTISGTGTCTLTGFNNSLTGGTATITFTTSGSWTGATFAVTNTGYGASASPTSATLASGSATCSGTPTLVTVLGGAQGNAMLLQSMKATQ
jgi:hypothetical protein